MPFLNKVINVRHFRNRGCTPQPAPGELKRQTHQEVLNRREIGDPLTVIETRPSWNLIAQKFMGDLTLAND